MEIKLDIILIVFGALIGLTGLIFGIISLIITIPNKGKTDIGIITIIISIISINSALLSSNISDKKHSDNESGEYIGLIDEVYDIDDLKEVDKQEDQFSGFWRDENNFCYIQKEVENKYIITEGYFSSQLDYGACISWQFEYCLKNDKLIFINDKQIDGRYFYNKVAYLDNNDLVFERDQGFNSNQKLIMYKCDVHPSIEDLEWCYMP